MRVSLVLLVAVALASPVTAAPRGCAQDPRGDALGQPVTGDQAMDLRGGDLTVGAKSLVVVVRTYALDARPMPASYRAVVATPGRDAFSVEGEVGPTGFRWQYGHGSGTYDLKRNEVRIVVPRAALPPWLRPGAKVTATYESLRAGVTMDTYAC